MRHSSVVARHARLACVAAAMLAVAQIIACSSGDGPPVAPEFRINIPAASIGVGESVQLTALQANGTVAWSTSNSAVATVVSTGFVTAVGPGSATITAATASQSASTAITVLQPPTIALGAAALAFSGRVGASAPPAGSVTIANAATGTLQNLRVADIRYGAGQPTGWLVATLNAITASATTPATLTLAPNVSALQAGTFTATVDIAASPAFNSPQSLTVTLDMRARPALTLSTSSFGLGSVAGSTSPATFALGVTASRDTIGSLSTRVAYSDSATVGWLSATLDRTTTPATVTVSANASQLPRGFYQGTVIVSSPEAILPSVSAIVSFTVLGPPTLAVSSPSLSFTSAVGAPNPAAQAVLVTNSGGGPLSFTTEYTSNQAANAFQITVDSLRTPSSIRVQPLSSGLAAGTYTGRVRITAPGAAGSPTDVQLSLTVGSAPAIVLSTSVLSFATTVGAASPSVQAVQISNGTASPVTGLSTAIVYSGGSGWLSATLSSTTAPSTLTLTPVSDALPIGSYSATVQVSSPVAGNTPQSIAVTLVVSAAPAIAVSTSPITFSGSATNAAAAQQRAITNGGGGNLSGLGATIQYTSGSGWLAVALSSTTAPSTLTLSAVAGSLTPGSYSAMVRVASAVAGNSPIFIPVTFNVTASPRISLSANNGAATAGEGNGTVSFPSIVITNSGSGTLSGISVVCVGSCASWFNGTFSSPTAPSTLSLTANAGTPGAPLAVGTYTQTVRVLSDVADNSPQDITLTFTVALSMANSGVWQAVYPTYCSGCHFAGGSQPNLSSPTLFRSNTVNVNNTVVVGYTLATTYPRRVVPGNHLQSYLWYELNAFAGAYRMPTGAAPLVGTTQRNLFRDWINQGAHP